MAVHGVHTAGSNGNLRVCVLMTFNPCCEHRSVDRLVFMQDVCIVNISTRPSRAEFWESFNITGRWVTMTAGSVCWCQEGGFMHRKWENNTSGLCESRPGQRCKK